VRYSESGNSDLMEVFKLCPIFSGVEEGELNKVAEVAVLMCFEKGEIIVREGELLSYLFTVKEGVVKVFKSSLSGRAFTIDVRHRGETFAELATLEGVPCFAPVIALEDTVVVGIDRNGLLVFIERNPVIAMNILRVEGERIRNLYSKVINLVADSASQRLIKVIHTLTSKYGNTLLLTHNEIAEMSGSTLETSTRVITQLKNNGILVPIRGKLIIKDQKKLQALSEGYL